MLEPGCISARLRTEAPRDGFSGNRKGEKASAQYLVLLMLAVSVFFSHAAFAADPVQMSAAFERFKYSFFEDPKSEQDALDTASLASLQGDERTRAEDMLIAFLPDARAVIGLGVLRSKKAEPQLKALGVMHTPEAVTALTKAIDDEDALVRFSAGRGLLAIFGLSYDPVDIQSMVYRVMADDAARRAGGKRDVLAAIAGRAMAGQ